MGVSYIQQTYFNRDLGLSGLMRCWRMGSISGFQKVLVAAGLHGLGFRLQAWRGEGCRFESFEGLGPLYRFYKGSCKGTRA